MNTRLAPADNLGRLEWWQVLEPQAGRFRLSVAELPRLDKLVVFASDQAGSEAVHDRVFDSDFLDWRMSEQTEELCRFFHLRPPHLIRLTFRGQPAHAAVAKVGAGREGNQHIPSIFQDFQYVALDMLARFFCWQ